MILREFIDVLNHWQYCNRCDLMMEKAKGLYVTAYTGKIAHIPKYLRDKEVMQIHAFVREYEKVSLIIWKIKVR